MYKRLMILLVTGLMMTQVIGCVNKNNQESTVTNESAVDHSTADSNDVQVDTEKSSEISSDKQSEFENDEPVIYEEADLVCKLPKGFVADKNEEGLYIHKNYPKDSSTISYVISESDEDLTQMSQEEYSNLIETDFMDTYGDEVEIIINSYEKIKVDGRNGLRVNLEYEFKGTEYEQLIYIIYNGNETHILNYTQEKEAGWMEEFEKSGDSISFEARK